MIGSRICSACFRRLLPKSSSTPTAARSATRSVPLPVTLLRSNICRAAPSAAYAHHSSVPGSSSRLSSNSLPLSPNCVPLGCKSCFWYKIECTGQNITPRHGQVVYAPLDCDAYIYGG